MTNYLFEGVFDQDEALSMPTAPENPTVDVDLPLTHEEVMTLNFPSVITSKESQCWVCTEEFEESQNGAITQITCGHVYHVHCITAWLCVRRTCPLCRLKVI
ncbi:hypothetical protein RND81_11G036600 [Saponaria officinalis]|uniref:RING-type E3 ubiquitin transferase n=1 Tax=Saponaria officinalis TaxID=3572 RepID=A0AAW1HHU1_SAPOF